jgi:hypothetical protein
MGLRCGELQVIAGMFLAVVLVVIFGGLVARIARVGGRKSRQSPAWLLRDLLKLTPALLTASTATIGEINCVLLSQPFDTWM